MSDWTTDTLKAVGTHTINHRDSVLSLEEIVRSDSHSVHLRLFTGTGCADFLITASEASEVVDLLVAAVARDAEAKLRAKETPIAGMTASFMGSMWPQQPVGSMVMHSGGHRQPQMSTAAAPSLSPIGTIIHGGSTK